VDLLNFLIYWSHRVYEWFGGLYESGRNAALYAYQWAVSRANLALSQAIIWANDRTNGALSTAWNWIIERYNSAISYIYSVRDYLLSVVSSIYGWVDGRWQTLANWTSGLIRDTQNLAARLVSDLQALAAGWIVTTQNYAAGLVNNVLNFAVSQLTGLQLEINEIKELLKGVNSAGTHVLGLFLSNPFGFIMAYIWDAFQDLLCFGLAYGMGTLKYELPPLPGWNGGGISGGTLPPAVIPIGNAGLVSPLGSISVSGYVFNDKHQGIDLGVSNGDPIYAMHAGRVLAAEFSSIGYGYNIVIAGDDWWSRYAHLNVFEVIPGEYVDVGQVIGRGDSTGNSTGPHLHLEIKYKGQFIDPLTVL